MTDNNINISAVFYRCGAYGVVSISYAPVGIGDL
jgi:hypothetical protein